MSAKLSMIIPVLNEERTFQTVLEKVLTLPHVSEFVLVNDGSTDGTGEIINKFAEKNPGRVKAVHHETNKGKGAGIRSGLEAATGDWAVVQDADLEYDPMETRELIKPLQDGRADVVYGSRFIRPNPTHYWSYKMGNKIITRFINLVAGGKLTDSYTCYKVMPLDKWRSLDLKSNGFEIEAEITTKALLKKWRMMEIPIGYAPRSFEEGKKIRAKDAFKGMWTSLKIRMNGFS